MSPSPNPGGPRSPRTTVIAGPFVLAIGVLLFLAWGGFWTLSAMRAAVAAHTVWASAQKQAVYSLHRYGTRGDAAELDRYERTMAVILANRQAREALDAPRPDLAAAQQAFVRGGSHPQDARNLVRVYRWFHRLPFLERAIAIWREADVLVDELRRTGEDLRGEMESEGPSPDRIEALLGRIDTINDHITALEAPFASALGAGSRATVPLLFTLLSLTGLVMALAALGQARRSLGRLEESERALRESEERYRRFFEEDLTGDFITRPDGTIVACNPAFARIFGFDSVDEVLRCRAEELSLSPEQRAAFLERMRREGRIERHETRVRRRDGTLAHVVENAIASFDERGGLVAIRGYLFDISEHKSVEERLRQSQKLEAIGRLAGGIAHDFNNLLTAVIGYADLSVQELGEDHPTTAHVHEIRKAGDRAMTLTRQLLAFGRKQLMAPRALALNDVVRDSEDMLRRLIGADIDVVTDLDTALATVHADPTQVIQILVNLAVNGRDAMPGGGRLTLGTRNVVVEGPAVPVALGPPPGRFVELAVTDTGHGMDADTRDRIFEPFFSTKGSAGTGLGLATVYGIVKQSGGYVYVESEPGRFTRFRVLLPATDLEAEAVPRPTEDDALPRGSERILVVEDEESVRALARRALERLGYRVVEARDGMEALALCARPDPGVDLVFSDVVMPRLGGIELEASLRKARPELPVLLTSGHPRTRGGVSALPSGVRFLPKPYGPASLAHAVRALLDGTPPGPVSGPGR